MPSRRLLITTSLLAATLGAPITAAEAVASHSTVHPLRHHHARHRHLHHRHRSRLYLRMASLKAPAPSTHTVTASASTATTTTATSTKTATSSTTTSSTGTVLFDGTYKKSWGLDQSATQSRVQNVADPTGITGNVLKFTTSQSDVYPLTPTANPRSQLVTPDTILKANQAFWESYEVYLPATFPVAGTYTGWLGLGSPFYGAPFNGTPSTGMAIDSGDFRWQANAYAAKPWQVLWQTPVTLAKWIRFTWFIKPSASGFAELYVNDQPVSVTYAGVKQNGAALPVIDPTDNVGPWASQLQVYYQANMLSSATVYFKNFKIATTQQAVES
jgi:hypothetical protein